MELVQNFPLLSIIIMTSCGAICTLLKGKAAKWYCLVCLAATLALNLFAFFYTLQNGAYVYFMGRWSAPWGNEIKVGVIEALLASAFAFVMILSVLGGLEHILEDVESTKVNLYFVMIAFLMLTLLILVYTNDIFTAYVFVEINTIASCALVMMRYKPGKTLVATTKYMIMSLLGSSLFLFAVCILYNITGHLLMEPMGQEVRRLYAEGQYLFPLTVAIAFMGVGLSIKGALFPFHTWLPDAHGSATTTSSAVLSGLVLKGYIFLLIKIYCRVIGLDVLAGDHMPDVLFLFGAAAMVIGSVRAMQQTDLKRLLAYSSISQVGYIFVGLGLGTEAGIAAAIVQILAHAVTTPMLFCAAGGFMNVSGGSRKLQDMTGAGRRDPLSGVAFLVGAFSMIGIPLFAGFITKLTLTQAALGHGSVKCVLALIVIIVSTVLNALYYIPTVSTLFSARNDLTPYRNRYAHYHVPYVAAMVLFMIVNICVGTLAGPLLEAIYAGLPSLGM